MGDDLECNDDQGDDDMVTPVQDIRVAVDISSMITEALINEMNDKNWKVVLYFRDILFQLKKDLF